MASIDVSKTKVDRLVCGTVVTMLDGLPKRHAFDPGHGGRVSVEAKCLEAHVLRFRCSLKNQSLLKFLEPSSIMHLIVT